MPCGQRSLHLNGATNDFDNIKVEVPKGVDGQIIDMLERCMATCRKAAGTRAKMRSRARNEASAQEVRGYYKQFAEAKHLEYRSWVATKFLISSTWGCASRETMWPDDGCSPSRRTSKATSSEQRPDGYWEVSKTNKISSHRVSNSWISSFRIATANKSANSNTGFINASDPEVIADHASDLSSAKESIFFLSFLFLQTDLFLVVELWMVSFSADAFLASSNSKSGKGVYPLNHPLNGPSPLLWHIELLP